MAEVGDDAAATLHGEPLPHLRLVDNRSHCVILLVGVELLEGFGDVRDAEQTVDAPEHFRVVRRKIWGERAGGAALPPLVSTRGTRRSCSALYCHADLIILKNVAENGSSEL